MAQRATPAPLLDPNEIVVHEDGTTSAPVFINAGGVVRFSVPKYPGQTTLCIIPFGKITFETAKRGKKHAKISITPDSGGGGTVKVGS